MAVLPPPQRWDIVGHSRDEAKQKSLFGVGEDVTAPLQPPGQENLWEEALLSAPKAGDIGLMNMVLSGHPA